MPAFDQRIVTLVHLRGTVTDCELFEAACAARGWVVLVAPAERPTEPAALADLTYTVEVRLLGSSLGAVYGARSRVETLGDDLSLELTVQAAELLRRRTIGTRAWHAYHMPSPLPVSRPAKWWLETQKFFGWRDTGRQVRAATRAEAITLARRPLPGLPPARPGLRLRGGEEAADLDARLGRRELRVRLAWLGHLWLLLWLVAATGNVYPFEIIGPVLWSLAAFASAGYAHRAWGVAPWKCVVGALLFLGLSYLGSLTRPAPFEDASGEVLQLAIAAYLVAVGLRLLIRTLRWQSWMPWLFPAALPLLLVFLPGLGTVVHSYYLTAFGFDPDDVGIHVLRRATASAKVAVAMSLWLVAPAMWGYLKHFHRVVRDRWLYGALTALFTLVAFVGGPVYLAVQPAVDAGEAARAAAYDGRGLPPYYGITPEWVCVRPVVPVAELPGEGAAITSTSPYLLLGDASLPAADRGRPCPAAS
ncbi:hypothetical protein [Streptomyces mesophilus]|uniref:hypothetical protein n=1 Tax=Streptomyces mesophilus TaxID=1775132 RepID=UPI00331E9E9C